MVNKKQQERVRKRDFSAIVIAVSGILVGGFLIGLGIYNNVTAPYNLMHVKSLDDTKKEVMEKNKKLEDLKANLRTEYDRSAISEEYEKIARAVSSAESELLDAEAELFNVQTGKYDQAKNNKIKNSVPLILIGVIVMIGAFGLALRKNAGGKKNIILTMNIENEEK